MNIDNGQHWNFPCWQLSDLDAGEDQRAPSHFEGGFAALIVIISTDLSVLFACLFVCLFVVSLNFVYSFVCLLCPPETCRTRRGPRWVHTPRSRCQSTWRRIIFSWQSWDKFLVSVTALLGADVWGGAGWGLKGSILVRVRRGSKSRRGWAVELVSWEICSCCTPSTRAHGAHVPSRLARPMFQAVLTNLVFSLKLQVVAYFYRDRLIRRQGVWGVDLALFTMQLWQLTVCCP